MNTDLHVEKIRGDRGLDEEINRPFKVERAGKPNPFALMMICMSFLP
jgi:hypothetical protein